METLDGTEWDVVIADTGFVASLLALSLSRSGKRILHLDSREYYGGDEAALSLSEAEAWASRHFEDDVTATYSKASAIRRDAHTAAKLLSSRAYSVALAPHLLYARSNLVPALVSSQCHNQLDFQAVGSWFTATTPSDSAARLVRVPSSREDVFQDTSLDLKAKRSLMKFLRFVAAYEDQSATWHDSKTEPFTSFLERKFGLPPTSHGPILALTMASAFISTEEALPRIARHMRSIGIFGPGFGAVLPKWGGLAEISQVACRACAVGGGVYVLNKAIKKTSKTPEGTTISLELDNDEHISTSLLCGSEKGIQQHNEPPPHGAVPSNVVSKSITIVSSSLSILFPPTSEGGVSPAGAVVVIPGSDEILPPVHIFVHTADAGECPTNQSVIYAATALPHSTGYSHLDEAVATLLAGTGITPSPEVLWKMQYQQRSSTIPTKGDVRDGFVVLPSLSNSLVLEDSVLEDVKKAWRSVTGESDDTFMKFEVRSGAREDE